jgi:hypothetical protein
MAVVSLLTVDAVSFRYMEYWITAPLLFLAVISLLTVDAPAWYAQPDQ